MLKLKAFHNYFFQNPIKIPRCNSTLAHERFPNIVVKKGHCTAISILFQTNCVERLKGVIVLAERLDGVDSKERSINVFALRMNMLFMVLKDMSSNLLNAFIIVIEVINVDVMTLAVFRIIQLLRIDAF